MLPPNNDPCVICPQLVPDWTHAGAIGDTFIWSEPPWDQPATAGQRQIYVLSGSSVCSDSEKGGHWCGWDAGTPQVLLFRSTDLINWEFVNVFWRGPYPRTAANGGSLYTPDTFALPDGRQALIYLTGPTRWATGGFDVNNGTFAPGAPSAQRRTDGVELGLGHCGQSMTDAKGRRVQFGWQGLSISGAPYTGAQSLPRVVEVAPPERGGGLKFAPLPELSTLHAAGSHVHKAATVAPAGFTYLDGVDKPTGLHHHMRLNVTLALNGTSSGATLVVCVLCGPGDSGVQASVELSSAPTLSATLAGVTLPLPPPTGATATVTLDMFVDGAIVELFVFGGEQTAYHAVSSARSFGVGLAATGSPAPVALDLWRMEQSVF